jgi:hypothetical protein
LPDSATVECFVVNIAPFKTAADDLLQNLVENLTQSLRTHLREDTERVEAFAKLALEKLKSKPATMQAMQAAQRDYLELKAQKREM